MTKFQQEPPLKWIATGLVACFILSGIAFYSFSVDIRQIDADHYSAREKSSLHR
jgi:hypothetical protein